MGYEDIATSPELAVTLMYYWSGLGPLPANVKDWVDASTKLQACDTAHRTRHLRANAGDNSFGYVYTTSEYPSAAHEDNKSFVRAAQHELDIAVLRTRVAGIVSRGSQGSGSGPGGRNNISYSGRNLAKCFNNTDEANTDPQGTKRDSAAMVSMWRTLMAPQDAQAVWEGCEPSGVMDALGYDL